MREALCESSSLGRREDKKVAHQYFFAATALPPLQLAMTPETSFLELMEFLKTNLHKSDFEQVQALRRYYDVENVRALLLGKPLDERGSFSAFELEEVLHGVDGAPPYFEEFYSSYESDESRLRHFAHLIALYFAWEIDHSSGFLRRYLQFERSWRLVATAIRAKLTHRPLLVELQFEEPSDPLVAFLIAQKEGSQIEPPAGLEPLKHLFHEHSDDPLALERALCAWRFEKIEELLGVELFSIGRILGYVAQLITVEKWLSFDKKEGLHRIHTTLKEAS